MKTAILFPALAALVAITFLAAPAPVLAEDDLAPKLRAALLKVHVTSQPWDQRAPWNKGSPRQRWIRGVVVRPGLVLCPASWLSDHVMIEVSEANSARRYPAELAHIDYSADLALVKIQDDSLLARTAPLPMGEPVKIDDEFEVWQLGNSDLLERATGRVQKVAAASVRLQLTIKTTLSDPGNGQAVVKDGKVVGIVIRTFSSRQEGTVTAVETVRHFLSDFDTGKYRGFGAGGIWTRKLLRDDLRAYHEVPDDQHGVGVSHVVPGRTGDGVVMGGDVITHLAGHDLDDEGMFVHPVHGRLHMGYLLFGSTHPGDKVAARILRKGRPKDVEIEVRDWPSKEMLVPPAPRDARPTYLVVGGLVLMELHQSMRTSPQLGEYQRRAKWDAQGERKRIVVSTRVLADPANKGFEEFVNVAVLTVNGKKITRLQDIPEALKSPVGGFHVFTFEGIVKDFVVKADELADLDQRIAKRYRIPELSFLGDD